MFKSLYAYIAMFFDEAEIVRKGTVYRLPTNEKIVALTSNQDKQKELETKLAKITAENTKIIEEGGQLSKEKRISFEQIK